MTDAIEVRDLVVHYGGPGGVLAVNGANISVARGKQLTLLGPSGCGKTTTLRCIAGLETPTSGEIRIEGEVVYSSARGINLPTEKRNLSMMFQSYAIWPHMTIFENVAYGLRIRGFSREQIRARVGEALEMVGMPHLADREAARLSGGQQQRVALARSIVFHPRALLMDEPLSNLDARLRAQMRDMIKELQRSVGITTIYVTHDQDEALALSDQITVMRDGRIDQQGSPTEIYETPRTAFVANFVGAANIVQGQLTLDAQGQPVLQATGGVTLTCNHSDRAMARLEKSCEVAIRAVYPRLCRSAPAGGANTWPGTVQRRVFLGDTVIYTVDWAAGRLEVRALPHDLFGEGDPVWIHIAPEHVNVLEDGGESNK